MSRDPRKLEDLLDGVLARGPLAEGLERQQALAIWPEVVGADIACRSRAVSLHDGVLRVEVDGSVWAQELQLLTPDILRAFRERLGDDSIEQIRFHSGRRDGSRDTTTKR